MTEAFDRREAMKRLAAAAMTPLVVRYHPAIPAAESAWRPRLFGEAEVATVADLAERILPETDTPGARQALVHQYIDWVLAEADPAAQDRFRDGLRSLDEASAGLFGKPFIDVEAEQQDRVLSSLEDTEFFREAKRLTIDGYYRSEPGMKQELGFEGNAFLAEFEGCNHPEHRSWKPGS